MGDNLTYNFHAFQSEPESIARSSLERSSVDEMNTSAQDMTNHPNPHRLCLEQNTFYPPGAASHHEHTNKIRMTGAPWEDTNGSSAPVLGNFKEPQHNVKPQVSRSVTKPVQIVEMSSRKLLKKVIDKVTWVAPKDRLALQTDNLAGIVSQVGNRPLAVLSITGPSRQGKSFILSYMVKYLRFHSASPCHTKNSDWMGKYRNESLRDGFEWKSGKDPHTLGIWMWPEPFTLKSADGSEFDVLLMDTQGVFDANTDKKDWATIVGLSLLTSSCLIFNISKQLEENILESLQKFMDFGLMARSQEEAVASDEEGPVTVTNKAFQKLIFLVRDWNFPDDHPYGVAGGAKYIHSKLNEKSTEDGEKIRTQIKSCFDQLDCCLMSDPGKYVKLNAYNGSVSKMDPDFADNIQEFIEHLFSPSSLAPKTILGNPVTGQDLQVYFEQLIQVFNGEEMPSNEDLTQATLKSCNQAVINRCFATYKNIFEQFPMPEMGNFLLDKELQLLSTKAEESSASQFESLRKMGSPEAITKAKEHLLELCQNFKSWFKHCNLNALNEHARGAERDFRAFIECNVEAQIRELKMGPDDFVSEKVFLTICEYCKSKSDTMLQKLLGIRSLNDMPHTIIERLQTFSVTCMEMAGKRNGVRRSNALRTLDELVVSLKKGYKREINKIITSHEYWQERELQREDAALRIEVMGNFCTVFSNSSIFTQGEQQLQTTIQEEFTSALALSQSRNETFLSRCEHHVKDLSKHYVELIEMYGGGGVEERSLTEAHEKAIQDCTSRLQKLEGFQRLDDEQKNKFEDNLLVSVENHCLHFVEKWTLRRRQKLLKMYKSRMDLTHRGTRNIYQDDKLEEEHTRQKTCAIINFEKFLSQLPITQCAHQKIPAVTKGMLQNFENEIENHMNDIRDKEVLRIGALQANAQGFLSKAKSKFLKFANASNKKCLNKGLFQLKHEENKLKVIQSFKDKCYENLGQREIPPLLMEELENFIKSVPQFKTLQHGEVLEISGALLKMSRELDVLESILESSLSSITEVRFIAPHEIALDENICSEFWRGKNLVMYTKQLSFHGSDRIIDVSGKKGKSAPSAPPVSQASQEPGANGANGEDGEPGESGGNVTILATTMLNPHYLKIVSNGGVGGSGQGGEDGSPGVDGEDGDNRFRLTLKDLEQKFPSPAKLFEFSDKNVKIGKHSLEQLALANGRPINMLDVGKGNGSNYCFELETKEGAMVRYGFYGKFKGYLTGKSFYVWYQGAPGTEGMPGGHGGLGGLGGCSGKAGEIDVPPEHAPSIVIMRSEGYRGREGAAGARGKDGVLGKQGTDCAIVDPYAGLLIPIENSLPIRKFQGNLNMVTVEERDSYINVARLINSVNRPLRWVAIPVTTPTMDQAAYCPHRRKYISFVELPSWNTRDVLKVHPEPKAPERSLPLKKTEIRQAIVKPALIANYGKF